MVAAEFVYGVRQIAVRRSRGEPRWFELRYRNGSADLCDLRRLADLLDRERYGKEFAETVGEVKGLCAAGDTNTFVSFSPAHRVPGDVDLSAESFHGDGAWVISSAGYRVRLTGRAGLEYVDEHGSLQLNAEMMTAPSISVFSDSFPVDRPEIVERVRRACLWDGLDVGLWPRLYESSTGVQATDWTVGQEHAVAAAFALGGHRMLPEFRRQGSQGWFLLSDLDYHSLTGDVRLIETILSQVLQCRVTIGIRG